NAPSPTCGAGGSGSALDAESTPWETPMAMLRLVLLSGLLLIVAGTSRTWGQATDQPGPAAAEGAVLDERAQRYHAALQRRPDPGYLYDRFVNTALDTMSSSA